jgi:hypothetical protein
MYGEPHLLGEVLGVLPGMSRVAFFRYATASLELSVIVLAALGLDDLAKTPERRRLVLWTALELLAVVAVAAIGARPLAHQLGSRFSHRPYLIGSIAWGAAILIAAAGAALVRDSRLRTFLLAVIVAGDALVLFAIPENSAPRGAQTDLAPVAFLQQHLGPSRFFTLGPLQPNYGSYWGIGSLNINDVPVPSVFADYVHKHLDPVVDPTVFVGNYGGGRSLFEPSPMQELLKNLAAYRAAGVAYVLVPRGRPSPEPGNFQAGVQ